MPPRLQSLSPSSQYAVTSLTQLPSLAQQNMDLRDRITKREPAPGPQEAEYVSSPDPVLQLASVDNGTRPVKLEKLSKNNLDGTSGPSFPRVRFEMESNDHHHQADITQPSDGSEDCTTTEDIEPQDLPLMGFLHETRAILDQRDAKVEQMFANTLQILVSIAENKDTQHNQNSASVEIADLKSMLMSEEESHRELSEDYRSLLQEFKQQGKKLERTNEKLHDVLRERDQLRQLLEGGPLANSAKTTDNTISSKWDELSYNIRNLAHLLANEPHVEQVGDFAANRLRSLTTDYIAILKDEEHYNALMQGYLWTLVWEGVFKSGQPVWGGPQASNFKIARESIFSRLLEGKMPDRPTSLAHAARCLAQGSAILRKLWEVNAGAVKRLVDTEIEFLKPFFIHRQTRNNRTDKKVNEQLTDIINSAIELDKMIMCSKAILTIQWSVPSNRSSSIVRFDQEFMHCCRRESQPSPKTRVKFVMSPFLYKSGTADGQNYDTAMVLAKAVVVCN